MYIYIYNFGVWGLEFEDPDNLSEVISLYLFRILPMDPFRAPVGPVARVRNLAGIAVRGLLCEVARAPCGLHVPTSRPLDLGDNKRYSRALGTNATNYILWRGQS